uniref:Uncharacterized protein n=1 Tax=viral metagenome TaxID=1070528 RepID=A0A6C0KIU8_9ZZZZ
MSARLNMKKIREFSWKGKTFTEITSLLKKNNTTINTNFSKNSYFIPRPLKIYRREVVVGNSKNCNLKTSTLIRDFDMPGGTIVNSKASTKNGLTNTLDINLTENKYERPGTSTVCFSQADNARRRVRSGGMIKRQFDITKNNDTYHTSTNQYLVSRNRTFQQNQYNYIKQGSANVKPGDALSKQNVYSANGINHCSKYYIPTATTFQYQWFDIPNYNNPGINGEIGNYYTVTIPAGYYSVEEVNAVFQQTMTNNFHYFVERSTKLKVFLLAIAYNNSTQLVELQSVETNNSIFNSIRYSFPLDNTNNEVLTWASYLLDTSQTSNITNWPGFKISANLFSTAIGFAAGNYPSNIIGIDYQANQLVQGYTGNLTFSSSYKPGLISLYIPIYYKPNNPQFAQQGAVSASSHTSRSRYNSITNNTVKYQQAYGLSVANALAYGVPEGGYTFKDKIGYPLKKTPVFSKYSNSMRTCSATKISNMI